MGDVEWLSDSQQRAWRSYIDGTNLLLSHLGEVLERDPAINLTFAEYEIMVRLEEAEGKALRMSELAAAVVHSRSRTTHTVKRLETRDYVARRASSSDGRGVEAILTDVGLAALVAAAPTHVASVREAFLDVLNPEELRRMGELMALIAERLRS